ncbi:hypothetical protein [Embleya scabrispora]|uniref:hypothetical protein n=1 Tax=Embleya scabrispora TaxID=159449 RepID=UPI000362756A|nr:hypothetical protein [Embleya scabrispora]MYS84759.1 hypothetical protein [Streptomyces sp. SID5474]
MARPGDWSALGLDNDPTPGDADRIDRVIAAALAFVELSRDIDNGLTEVKNTSSAVFVGKTAEALRGVIDGKLRNYISTFRKAHEDVRSALTVYVGVMRHEQHRADTALSAAAALSEDDKEGRAAHKATAEDAKSILSTAADTAARKMIAAGQSIASPVDECEEFWKALGWIAMILAIPAIFVGGPLALLSIALNVALLIKTAIDFAHGKASVTQLVLGILGMIAPTTKGLHLGALWSGIKGVGGRGITGTKNFFTGGANSFGLFGRVGLGIDDAVAAAGAWIRGGAQGLKLGPISGLGPGFGKLAGGIRFFPLGTELTVINMAGAKTFFGLRSVITTLNAFKGLGASIANGLSGFKGLRLFLPVAADEMGKGLGLAFRIGFIDRGILGMYRYGAFIDGKFIGAGSKISAGVNAGFNAFGHGGELVKLPNMHLGTFDPVHMGPLGGRFDMPPMSTKFTNGFGHFDVINVPSLGTFGTGFHAGNFPGLGTFLDNMGGLAGMAPLTGFGAKIADIPSFSFTGLGSTHLIGNLSVPPGITGLGATGVHALPPALGHISIPNLDTVGAGATNKIELGLPGSSALVHDLPTTNANTHTGLDGLGTVAVPQPGHVAMPDVSTPALPHVNVSGVGSLPLTSHIQTPNVGAVPNTGHIATPSASGLGGLGHLATPNVGGVPAVTHLTTPHTGAPIHMADVNTPNPGTLRAGVDGQTSLVGHGANPVDVKGVQSLGGTGTHIDLNGSRVLLGGPSSGMVVPGHPAPGGLPGVPAVPGGLTSGAHFVPASGATNNLTVFMMQGAHYDFAHTFGTIPGLNGVEVRVLPSTQAGRTVDVHIDPGGRTDISATHITVGDQEVLRIERALGDGGTHRWDYELSAANNHRLLDDQIIDTHVTGPVPGQAIELTTLPTPQLPHTTATGSTLPAGAGPGQRVVDIPGLSGTHLEYRVGDGGGIEGIRITGGGAGAPHLNPSRLTGPDGNTIVRVEQNVIPNVEVRRWDFDVSAEGGRPDRIERRITLTGGEHDDTLVAIHVDPDNRTLGVTHFDDEGNILGPDGPPVRINDAGIVVPSPGGFHLYDPATGTPSGSGLRLIGSNGHPLALHVLTPNGVGARTLVGVDATGTLGVVSVPEHANGMFHVVPTGTGPTVRVFGADGRFSHNSLPLTGIDRLGLAGGHIRSPHVGTAQIAHADGRPVPDTDVIRQIGNEFRIRHPGGQFHVDARGARAHDVVTLTTPDGTGTGLHVFTPVGGPNPLPHLRAGDGAPSTTANVDTVDNTFHVTGTSGQPHVVQVHTPGGGYSHNALPLTGGGAPGGFIRLPDTAGGVPRLAHGDGRIVPNTDVTPQHGGGYLVHHPDGTIVVNNAGAHTHDVLELTAAGAATGRFVHTPVGTPDVPVPHPNNRAGVPDTHLTVTRVGGELRLTDPEGSFAAHGLDGAHRYDATHLTGGPFDGRFVRFDGRTGTLVDGNLAAVPNTRVVRQTGMPGGGFRVGDGTDHIIVDMRGAHRFDVVGLRGADGAPTREFVFTPAPVTGAPAPGPAALAKGPDGRNLGITVVGRPDGTLRLTDMETGMLRGFSGTGAFEFQVLRLTGTRGAELPQLIRVHPGGAHTLVDDALADIADTTVRTRPGGGFHVAGADGEFRLFGRTGNLDLHVTSRAVTHGDGEITVFRVDDGAGTHRFDMIGLSDARIGDPAHTRFLNISTGDLRVLDGHLDPLPGLRATAQPGGGYRVDGIGMRTGEFQRFDAGGRLEFQRIDVVGARGGIDPNRHFELTYPAGGEATWTLVRTDAHGVPVAGPATRKWFEGGTLDLTGADAGRVHLISHLKVTVFERRTLPDGNILDAHHSSATLGTFGLLNQRGTWAEFGPEGNLIHHGTRHWGESTRSWFDVKNVFGVDVRVRHFQLSADGGHVLADLRHMPATQGFAADTKWVRFDADFRAIASGDRHWSSGPGRGWTDTMHHPITNEIVTVQKKFGRFQFGLHDVRRYHQVELGPGGVPTRDWVSRHADGNINGLGKTLHNGDFLKFERFAEQRPPVFFRNMFSGEFRAADLSRHPWLAQDSRLRVGTWKQEPAGGGPEGHGVQFITNNKTVIDVAHTGEIVRETRPLHNGGTLTVGDVRLPDVAGAPVAHRAGYLPWSEGVGGLQGHRTFHEGDFAVTPGTGERQITWQDRITDDVDDGDWYTPGTKQWTVVRTGLSDGTFIDYRPRPTEGAAGGTGPNTRGLIDAHAGNWIRYDHHGMVVSRSDVFPTPDGTGHVDIIGTMGRNPREFRWHDALDPTIGGKRITAFERQITPWHFDRESFQDFDAAGNLIRDHRQLGEGLSVQGWRGVDAAGNEVWHWNKLDADNNAMGFGNGAGDRIRHWFDKHGNPLPGWAKGARWSDRIAGLDNQVVQEIPARRYTNSFRDFFTDSPFRVRDFRPTLTTEFNRHLWQESDQGLVAQAKIRLPDGTFLEINNFNKHARRYDIDGITVINERTIPGYIHEYDANGGVIIGRETHFTGLANEYRGLNRTYREPNRWGYGPSVDGEVVPEPFALRAIQSIGIDMSHEFLLDFTVNLVVLSMVRTLSGGGLSMIDVGRAAFGAALSSMTKGTVSAAHMAANRGGWKVHWSNIDYGQPGSWRPNDDSWPTEWGANERPVRWRGGTYEFALGLGTGSVAGFVSGASQAAIFGVRGADGAIIKLTGGDAALAGLASMVGGVLGTVSVGALRALVQHSLGSRWVHRQGPMDIFVIGGLGKMVEKLFGLLVLSPATVRLIGHVPDGTSSDNLLPGSGTGTG